MKKINIAFYDTKPYDKESFLLMNKNFGFNIEFFDFHLNEKTAFSFFKKASDKKIKRKTTSLAEMIRLNRLFGLINPQKKKNNPSCRNDKIKPNFRSYKTPKGRKTSQKRPQQCEYHKYSRFFYL